MPALSRCTAHLLHLQYPVTAATPAANVTALKDGKYDTLDVSSLGGEWVLGFQLLLHLFAALPCLPPAACRLPPAACRLPPAACRLPCLLASAA